MRFFKDLIPKEHKVLPDYFQVLPSQRGVQPTKTPIWTTLMSILFFILAICFFKRFLIAVVLGLIGLLFTRKGKRWLEKKGSFWLSPKIRIGLGAVLLILLVPLYGYYEHRDADIAHQIEIARQNRLKFTADSLNKETLRKDSLDYYLKKVKNEGSQNATINLKKAEVFALTEIERKNVKQIKISVSRDIAKSLFLKGRSKAALAIYAALLTENPNDADVLYDRAKYYVRSGNIKAAVADLTASTEYGNQLASKLYNKVNPIRKRIAYYVTRCCDGTTSGSSGRGACSWHGGICNSSEPVYEEYRRY